VRRVRNAIGFEIKEKVTVMIFLWHIPINQAI
jgi:hypothetical protein